ncbi:YceD family protein [Simkania sp.]|uniref:YceD family protein n=1 Tax=Simkania sp. TaxID=34094 RepID=UPI003B53015B
MEPELKVYLDRLQGGKTEIIDLTLSSTFMDVDEADLKFNDRVIIKGKAYLANDHLVIHLKVETKVSIPCSVCNKMVLIPIRVPEFYHTEDLEEVKGRVYYYANPLREAILLEVPPFGECLGGCAERKELEKYKPSEGNTDSVQFPFADLT